MVVLIINWSGTKLSRVFFYIVIRIRPGIAKQILRNTDESLIYSLCEACNGVSRYRVFGLDQAGEYLYKVLKDPSYEEINLPTVWGVSEGGTVSIRDRGVHLFEFHDAAFIPLSDFIRLGNEVYWDKYNRFQLVKTMAGDKDLIFNDKAENVVYLESSSKTKKVKTGFSLCGVHASSWGHFIGNFLPKLAALESIENREELSVILPSGVDAHIIEMVTIVARNYGVYSLALLEEDEMVLCEKLYYCSAPSFIADHAEYVQPYDDHLSYWAVSKLHSITARYNSYSLAIKPRTRLFIGRRGVRNMKNWKEVEDYFVDNGFEVIFPHQLSLSDKVRKFASATHVCGPYSSGIANVIFCQPGTKVLAFSNISRVMDCYLSDLAKSRFNLNAVLLTGDEEYPAGPHQDYEIPLPRIVAAVEDMKYFE